MQAPFIDLSSLRTIKGQTFTFYTTHGREEIRHGGRQLGVCVGPLQPHCLWVTFWRPCRVGLQPGNVYLQGVQCRDWCGNKAPRIYEGKGAASKPEAAAAALCQRPGLARTACKLALLPTRPELPSLALQIWAPRHQLPL